MDKVKLGDIAKIAISNVDKKSKPNEKTVRLCNFVDVYKNWSIDLDNVTSFMVATASDRQISNFSIKPGQVAITKDSETRDDIGIATYIADAPHDVVLGYHCALITPVREKLDGSYLNALLHSSYARKVFEFNASGSGQRYTLTAEVLEGLILEVPDIETQKTTGFLFEQIEKKIKCNKRLIKELEETARLIYDYWFTQFDFPDENGKPYRSSGGKMAWNGELKREIPSGWEVREIGSLLSRVKKTTRINADQYLPEGSTPVIDQGEGIIAGYTDDAGSILEPESCYIVFGDHTRRVKRIGFPFARGADGTQILSSHTVPNELLYQIVSRIDLSNYGYARHFKFLKQSKCVIPESNVATKFAKLVAPISAKQDDLLLENISLERLRDWLLPMLINGQVKVD